jgi:hypothetical protein
MPASGVRHGLLHAHRRGCPRRELEIEPTVVDAALDQLVKAERLVDVQHGIRGGRSDSVGFQAARQDVQAVPHDP